MPHAAHAARSVAGVLDMVAQEFQFDRFVFRPQARELLDSGAPVRIGGRAFDLLSRWSRRAATWCRAMRCLRAPGPAAW